MTDREFWLRVRRGLLEVVRAVEERYDIKASDDCPPVTTQAVAADYRRLGASGHFGRHPST